MNGMDEPDVVFEELMEECKYAFANQERNMQTDIGPSQVGNPCVRAVVNQLAGIPEPLDARGGVNFKAEVGTMVHAGLAEIFRKSPLNLPRRRYLVETNLAIGEYAGRELTGTCDLFDVMTGGVVDWKTKGKTSLLHVRRHGMSEQVRVQLQLYGLGWHRLGCRVNWVGAVFIPRDGELSEAFMSAEPFDEQAGVQALKRLDRLALAVDQYGVHEALRLFGDPVCDDQWCRWCPKPPARKFKANGDGSTDDPFDLQGDVQ